MKEAKHIIWSNYGLDYEDWREDLEAEYPSLSENERLFLMYEINSEYLNDERMNLNVQLSQPILMVGDLELWDGQRTGYKEIKSGNIRDCLYGDTDYSTWYVVFGWQAPAADPRNYDEQGQPIKRKNKDRGEAR